MQQDDELELGIFEGQTAASFRENFTEAILNTDTSGLVPLNWAIMDQLGGELRTAFPDLDWTPGRETTFQVYTLMYMMWYHTRNRPVFAMHIMAALGVPLAKELRGEAEDEVTQAEFDNLVAQIDESWAPTPVDLRVDTEAVSEALTDNVRSTLIGNAIRNLPNRPMPVEEVITLLYTLEEELKEAGL